jgi:Protein of unknown function (DUF664)
MKPCVRPVRAWATWREDAFAEQFVAARPVSGPRQQELPLREVLVSHERGVRRHNGHKDLLRERIDGRVGQ